MRVRVAFTGGDKVGWALDNELRVTREILDWVTPSSLLTAQVIHTVTWHSIPLYPRVLLRGRRVIAHLTHDPSVAETLPGFAAARNVVSTWIVRSLRARDWMERLGLRARLIPYAIDHRQFRRLPDRELRREQFRRDHGIPGDAYLIGSFQRDTESDLRSPKLVKGPDIFAEVVGAAAARGVKVHVLLAGPRRFWLRERLRALAIPYTWLGEHLAPQSTLPPVPFAQMNELYNLVDLYVVSSRLEGGPQAVLEAAASECRILSTRVGHAPDILDSACIYETPAAAADVIAADAATGVLERSIQSNLQSSMRSSLDAVRPLWRSAYEELLNTPRLGRQDVRELPGVLEFLVRRLRRA